MLVLTAMLAVGVPGGLLAACSSQGGQGGQGGQSSQGSQGSQASPGVSSATAVAVPKTDARAARESRPRRQSSPLAVNLMTEAAQAAVATTYQGEQWEYGGGTVLVSEIWHVSGGQTVTQTIATGTGASGQPYLSADPDGDSPEGVLGVTTTLVKLLESHYVVIYAGSASADNRAAQVVEAWRADGSLAARYWLDSATKLPLERQVFDTTAHVINQGVFVNVQFGQAPAEGPAMAFVPGQVADPAATSWSSRLPPAKLLSLQQQGWRVLPALPGDLILFTGGETDTASGRVLDLGYSDGLYVVSLFEQHGKLAAKLPGWQKVVVGGRIVDTAVPSRRSFTWAGDGLVYTLIADAPSQTVATVVGALPYDKPPGFWNRMSRGLAKLAGLVNPFK
jgi:sigma-E factor negative regulatory protein RseB